LPISGGTKTKVWGWENLKKVCSDGSENVCERKTMRARRKFGKKTVKIKRKKN